VPSRNRLGTPLTLKQFLAAYQLGVIAIPNFEPRSLLRSVGCPSVFRDDTLEVQLASFLEEGNSSSLYVLSVKDE
jgi:hypothetical protein